MGILLPEAYQESLNAALRHADNATKEMFFEQTLEFFRGAHKVRL